MWDPSILYVLKRKESNWKLLHYQYYTSGKIDSGESFDNPIIDSIIMKSVVPREITWGMYVEDLDLDSLWSMVTESEIDGKKFGVLDGSRSLLELREGKNYKYLYYTQPNAFIDKDDNHKRFVKFRRRIIDPIIYNGMRNP